MTLLVIVRPEPGAAATLADARARGLAAVSYPLFAVQPVPWQGPAPASVDALLLGSANSVRRGGAGLLAYRGKPAYAVGATTALAAQAAGLAVVATGCGGMQALFAQLAPGHRRLLRLSGKARVVLKPPPGIIVDECVVYDSVAVAMPPDLERLLATCAPGAGVVLLHSAEAARHFARECDRLQVPRERLRLAALAPRIAEAAGGGWAQVATARQPDDAALLALAERLCQAPTIQTAKRYAPMADDTLTEPGLAEPGLIEPGLPPPARAPGRHIWFTAVTAFLLGLGAAGWVGWRSGADFSGFLGHSGNWPGIAGNPAADALRPGPASAVDVAQNAARDQLALAGRVAAMEQRVDRIDLRVEAASGNAARAEALLVAFAVRRVVERGAPLGYLADQLKLRFGDAQPHAVATIIGSAGVLVPLDQLAARLEALAPQLTASGRNNLWQRVTRELADLFVVRSDRPVRSDADVRFDDARRALSEGRIDDAVAQVQHLSNGADAASWSAAARRYRDVESALDLIDTTALLAPRELRDAGGNRANPVLH